MSISIIFCVVYTASDVCRGDHLAMTVSYTARLLLVCLLLFLICVSDGTPTHHKKFLGSFSSRAMSGLNSMLQELHNLAVSSNGVDHKMQGVERRQIAENNSDFCNDFFNTIVQQLNTSCLDSLSNLSVANDIYLASGIARRDINTVCSEGCAGVFLEYDNTCPDYLPNLSTYLRGICSENEHLERCAFSALDNDGLRVYQKCFVETDAFVRCRSRCRNALRDFSADIGCCINTFYNDTYTVFTNLQLFLPRLNYSIDPLLWETCGIPYPDECSPDLFPPEPSTPLITSLTPTPGPSSTPSLPPLLCSSTDETSIFSDSCLALLFEFQTPTGLQSLAMSGKNTSELCSVNCAGSYLKECAKTGDSVSETLELFCGEYKNEYCGPVIADSYSILLQNLSYCGTYSFSSSYNCSAKCHSVLVDVGVGLGCCAYALTLASVSEHAEIAVVDSRLWSSCDLQLPQKCPNLFPSDPEDSRNSTGNRSKYASVLTVHHRPVVLKLCNPLQLLPVSSLGHTFATHKSPTTDIHIHSLT